MGRLGSLMPLLMAASVGCTAISKKTIVEPINDAAYTAAKTVGMEPKRPVKEFSVTFANRLQQLPDPSKGGTLNPGLVGQVFLFANEFKPFEIDGELTIMVQDVTKRAPGLPVATPEAWHFTPEVLKRLRVDDERYGHSVAVFLPWPPEWKDVNTLMIQARYDQPGLPPIWARESTLTLDFSVSNGASAGGAVPSTIQKVYAVPDPKAVIDQMKVQKPLEVNGAWAGPSPGPIPQPAAKPMMPVSHGEFQRTVITR